MKALSFDAEVIKAAALDLSLNDYVIQNIKIVNVFTGEILPGKIYVKNGYISYVDYQNGSLPDRLQVIDGKGRYAVPGFIDSHVHIESSMLNPEHFSQVVVPFGTTTVACDPHELANVFGVEAFDYFINVSDDLPMRILVTLSSSVPSVEGLEHSGASIYAKDIAPFLSNPNAIGLGEVMDYEGILKGTKKTMDLIQATQKAGKYIQGHCPKLSGQKLAAYRLCGPESDHESSSYEELTEKYRQGFYIDLRDSNTNKRLSMFAEKIKSWPNKDRFTLCSDDRRCNITLKEGHINAIIRKVIKAGVDPIDAIRMGTLNPARELKLDRLGALAPGYLADIVFVDSLEEMSVSGVIHCGETVAENGSLTWSGQARSCDLEKVNMLRIPEIAKEDFLLKSSDSFPDRAHVNVMEYESYTSSFTSIVPQWLPVKSGYIDLSEEKDAMYAIVINRYGLPLKSIAVVKKFGITHGAVASSVSHDSHNIVIVYDCADNAYLALRQLEKQKGGMAAVEDGKVIASLPLPIGGLMSDRPAPEVAVQIEAMDEANRRLGNIYLANPTSRITILSLLACPAVKLSDMGLIDVEKQRLIPLFAD